MTALLKADPKAKDRALARQAIAQLGPSPLAEGTLRKAFGARRRSGQLPPLETEEDIEEERQIRDFFRRRDVERERNKLGLAMKLHEALAMGLDLGTLSLEAVQELGADLRRQVAQSEVTLGGRSFVMTAPSADEAIATQRNLKERLGVLRKQRDVVLEILGYRHRLGEHE